MEIATFLQTLVAFVIILALLHIITHVRKASLIVSYDLELTDGSFASEIFQIGAKCQKDCFTRNILPEGDIHPGVTKYATHITVREDAQGSRSLFDLKNDAHIPSVCGKDAFRDFLCWLKQQKQEGEFTEVVLVSHGTTDMPALINNLARADLVQEFLQNVDFMADSLKYFEENFRMWPKYKLHLIYEEVFPYRPKFNVHNALGDATALHDILEQVNKDTKRYKFVQNIKFHSDRSSACVRIAENKINKTLTKARNRRSLDSNNSVVKGLWI